MNSEGQGTYQPVVAAIVGLLLAAWLCLIVVSAAHAGTVPAGDVAPRGNPDSVLNVGDLVVVSQFVLGQLTPTAQEMGIADVAPVGSPDGVLDGADLAVLQRAILGLVTLPTVTLGPDPPTLDPAASPTNLNPYTVTGSASAGLEVRLYVNGVQQSSATAPTDGTFQFSTALVDGDNQVYATVWDGAAESAASNVLTITYANDISRSQSGIISRDTVWTPAGPGGSNDPYVITDNLTVASGVTFILQPGTTLRFQNNKELRINGTLRVAGTDAQPVVLTSDSSAPRRGDWAGVVITATSAGSLIDYAVVEYAVAGLTVDGANVTVRNSVFREFAEPGDNQWSVWGKAGIYLLNGAGGLIEGNQIDNGNQVGYGILLDGSSPQIKGNQIRNTYYGIGLYSLSSPMITDGNTISDNGYGVYVLGDNFGAPGTLGANPTPVLNGNSIYNNSQKNLYATLFYDARNTTLDAGGNWWGTTDTSVITRGVFDYKDDWGAFSPIVEVLPLLDGPSGAPVAGNFMNGLIAVDTTLSAGVPYEVVGSLVVAAAATLTLDPGAELHFADTALLSADGRLLVNGTATAPVLLRSTRTAAPAGSWEAVLVRGAGSVIDHAAIQDAVVALSIQAENTTVSNSTVQNFSGTGVSMGQGSNGSVQNNQIQGANRQGTGIAATAGAQVVIADNSVQNANVGILIWDSSPPVSGNLISNNNYGIQVTQPNKAHISNPNIYGGNVVTANDYGIYVQGDNWREGPEPAPVVTGNQIYGNSLYNYYATSFFSAYSTVLDATGNWWGTAEALAIFSSIRDYSDSASAPTVNFTPYLDAPNGDLVSNSLLAGPLADGLVLQSGQTYQADGSMVVMPGATLTIERGARLVFPAGTSLTVNGTLSVQGTSDNPVVFTSNQATPASGDWQGIVLGASGSRIDHAVIEYAYYGVEAIGADVTVTNSILRNNDTAVYLHHDLNTTSGRYPNGSIRGNDIYSNRSGVRLDLVGSPAIADNHIHDNVSTGLYIQRTAYAVVTGNVISANGDGVSLNSGYWAPALNTYYPYPTINDNAILGNTTWQVDVATGPANRSLDGENNWWGTVVASEIDALIRDYNDVNTRALLDFDPFLTAPVYLPPVLAASASLTADPQYAVTGTTAPGAGVHLYANGILQASGTAAPDGRFNLTATLTEGANSLYATSYSSAYESNPSNTITATLDTVPPTITITQPTATLINQIFVQVAGTLDEAGTVTVAGSPATVASDNSFLSDPVALTEGSNSIQVIATDLAGNSATQTVNLTVDATPPADVNMSLVSFAENADGTVSVTGAPGAAEAGANLNVVNGRSGELVSVTVGADGSFSAVIATQPGDELFILASDQVANETAWTSYAVSGGAPAVSVSITSPGDGAMIPADWVTVRGTFAGPANTGVIVPGAFTVTSGNTFVANRVPLSTSGATVIDVIATAPDGTSTSDQITVTSTAAAKVYVDVEPAFGLAPLGVSFTVREQNTVGHPVVDFDFDGDGTWDEQRILFPELGQSEVEVSYTYINPGFYQPIVRLTDGLANTYTHTLGVEVLSGMGAQGLFRSLYQGMLMQLKSGNISAGVQILSPSIRATFEQAFTELGTDLPGVIDQLGNLIHQH